MRLSLFLALLLAPSLTRAQGAGGVANSGMSQGEARISSRSDIRLSMEGVPGTSGARVSALGSRVGRRMSQVRACYTQTISEHPTVTGALRLRILLESDGPPTIEVERNETRDSALATCISGALAGLDHSGLSRPTHAVVQLEFANSAARGAERAARRAREARQVSVQIDADGNVTSTGGTPDQHVRFVVTGRGRESTAAVVAAHRALLTALPGLLDCRRRAGRRGQSSAGETRVVLRVRDGRPPASRVTRCTVEGRRSRGCVSRALRAIERRSEGGTGRVTVVITFSEAEAVAGARD